MNPAKQIPDFKEIDIALENIDESTMAVLAAHNKH